MFGAASEIRVMLRGQEQVTRRFLSTTVAAPADIE
jgi:hypothetical protein